MKRLITIFNHRTFSRSEQIAFNIYDPATPYYRSLGFVLGLIKTGRWGERIRQVREETDKNLKQTLPFIVFSAQVRGQKTNDLLNATGLMVLDFDDLPDIESARKEINEDAYTLASFVSAKGQGLKVILQLEKDIDADSHRAYYAAVANYYEDKHTGLYPYLDRSGCDIVRGCFASADKDLYINEKALTWTSRQATSTTPFLNESPPLPNITKEETQRIITYLEGTWKWKWPMIPHRRHDSTYFRARELAEWGVRKDEALNYFDAFMTGDVNKFDLYKQIDNAYENTAKKGKTGKFYREL